MVSSLTKRTSKRRRKTQLKHLYESGQQLKSWLISVKKAVFLGQYTGYENQAAFHSDEESRTTTTSENDAQSVWIAV
ncbi:hypothetical protein O9993_08735 [Vibrio lentus]|nr:hypothetical protein [Vibrio lentus]